MDNKIVVLSELKLLQKAEINFLIGTITLTPVAREKECLTKWLRVCAENIDEATTYYSYKQQEDGNLLITPTAPFPLQRTVELLKWYGFFTQQVEIVEIHSAKEEKSLVDNSEVPPKPTLSITHISPVK